MSSGRSTPLCALTLWFEIGESIPHLFERINYIDCGTILWFVAHAKYEANWSRTLSEEERHMSRAPWRISEEDSDRAVKMVTWEQPSTECTETEVFEEVSCYSYHIVLQPYCMTNFKRDEAAAPGEIRYKAYI